MRIYRNSTLALALLVVGGCSSGPSTSSVPASTPTSASAVTEAQATQTAKETFQQFGKTLKAELQKAISEAGPVNAVEVCHARAPQIAEEISKARGFSMGRSSHRLRNQNNAPDEDIARYLEKYSASGKEAPVAAVSTDEGWTVIAPIITQPLCVTCHGDPKTFSPELTQALNKYYPNDKATGFKPGDLRGVFWARL